MARISLFRHSLHPSLCSGPRLFFFSLSPSSLRCLFLSRSLPTPSSSCRLSRPHLFLPLLHLCFCLRSLSRYRFPLIFVCCSALSHSMLYLSFLLSLLLFVFPPSPLSPSVLPPLRLSSLSLFSLAPSLASLLLLLTTFCLHPSLSFFLYLISRPLLLPSLYLYSLICYFLPSFSFLLHLLALFSSRGLSLSLPTSLKHHSSRKRPTCSRGHLRSPCSPTSLRRDGGFVCRAGRRRQESVVRELEQGREEEANCCPPRSACPSCSRNHPHSFGRCPLDGGCQGLHGELLARWFACSCRVCGHHAVFADPEQGSLDEGFVQATKQGRQITTSLRPGKVQKLSPGPHVAISPLRAPPQAQRYPPTIAPTNRPTNHSE